MRRALDQKHHSLFVNKMFSFILYALLSGALAKCNAKNLILLTMMNSSDSHPDEVIPCLEYATFSFIERLPIILFAEEIVKIPWIDTFLRYSTYNPVIVISINEDISNIFGFHILFPEYRSQMTRRFRVNRVKSRFLAIWTRPVSSKPLLTVFKRFWSYRCTGILALAKLESDGDFGLYSYSAFSEGKCGLVQMVEVDKWNKTSAAFASDSNFYETNRLNLHKCVLKVMCNHRPPDSVMNINYETYEWETSGVSRRLLDIAEEYFNFSSVMHGSAVGGDLNQSWYFYTEELDLICDAVDSEAVDFAVGWFSYSAIEMDNLASRGVELGTVTSIDCFGWAVPLRAGIKPPNSAYYTEEFGYHAWSLIFVTLCLTSVVMRCTVRRSLSHVALVTVQTSLEQPVHNQSSLGGVSFGVLFSNFCFYSLVVSAAYKASFASFITVSLHGKDFSTVKEIIESPLRQCGSPNMFRVLNAATPSARAATRRMLDNFNILPPSNFEDVMIRLIRQRDVAVFGVKRNMYYHSMSEAKRLKMRISFRFIPGCLIRPHTTHFLFKRGSFLNRPFDRLLNRMFETGIASYWILHLGSNKILPTERLKEKNLRIHFFRTPFLALFTGFLIAYAVFILELICYRASQLDLWPRVKRYVRARARMERFRL